MRINQDQLVQKKLKWGMLSQFCKRFCVKPSKSACVFFSRTTHK